MSQLGIMLCQRIYIRKIYDSLAGLWHYDFSPQLHRRWYKK